VDRDKLLKGDPRAADSFPPTVENPLHPQVGRLGMSVPESPGRFCSHRGRFGPHSSNESFTPIYYRRLVFITYFNGGVREGRHAMRQRRRGRVVPGGDPDH